MAKSAFIILCVLLISSVIIAQPFQRMESDEVGRPVKDHNVITVPVRCPEGEEPGKQTKIVFH